MKSKLMFGRHKMVCNNYSVIYTRQVCPILKLFMEEKKLNE